MTPRRAPARTRQRPSRVLPPGTCPALLVTSADRLLVISRTAPGPEGLTLPQVPPQAADAVAALRRALDGEVFGLRRVGDFVDDEGHRIPVLAARLVGHGHGRWAASAEAAALLDPQHQPQLDAVTFVEVTPAELAGCARIWPVAAAAAVRQAVGGPDPFDVLLGPFAAHPYTAAR